MSNNIIEVEKTILRSSSVDAAYCAEVIKIDSTLTKVAEIPGIVTLKMKRGMPLHPLIDGVARFTGRAYRMTIATAAQRDTRAQRIAYLIAKIDTLEPGKYEIYS